MTEMFGLIRRNRRPTALRHLVSAIQRDAPANLGQNPGSLPSHHIFCAGTYTPVFARLAAEAALRACPPDLRRDFRLFIHVDGVAARSRADLMAWLREIPGVEVTYGLFGILANDRIPGKWHQVMINDVVREFGREPHLAFIDADLFVVDGSWWQQCRQHLADDVYAVTVGLRKNSAMAFNGKIHTAIRTNLFSLNTAAHNRLNQQRFNKDIRATEFLRAEYPDASFELGNMDTMISGSLRAQAHGFRIVDVMENVPHCHIGGFSHLKAEKFKDYEKPERLHSIRGLLAQARLLARVLEHFDRSGWGNRVDQAYRENVAHMTAFINEHKKLRQMQDDMPPASREVVFDQVMAMVGGSKP